MHRLVIENFDQEINQVSGPYLIKFFSPTCGPCHTMKPVFEAFEQQRTDFKVFEVDTMASPEIADMFNVRGVPFSAFCEGREIIYTFTGVTKLAELLYVAENINDPHMRETGEFNIQKSEKSSFYLWSILGVVLLYILIISII